MINNRTIGVVIPAYNEEKQIAKVISSIPDFVDKIVVVDDGSTDHTSAEALRFRTDDRFAKKIFVLRRKDNQGVGRAIAEGYKWMVERNIDVTVVMAGDGQMDPRELPKIVRPVIDGKVDYVKGSRLFNGNSWKKIPKERLVGNAILSFLTRIASGYWSLIDSQSGYTAISERALKTLDLDRIYNGYGVPNDILAKLNIFGFRIAQVPIEPVYNVGEKSKMKVGKVVFSISTLLLKLFFFRLFSKYLLRNFHPLLLFYLAGIALFLVGSVSSAAIMAVDIARTLRVAIEVEASHRWMLFSTILLLSGVNLLLFSMRMDMIKNRDLQINVLAKKKEDSPG